MTENYKYETGSMTGIHGQLKWESPKKRRKDNRLKLLYKGLKGKASVSTDDLILKTRRGRNQHSANRVFSNFEWICTCIVRADCDADKIAYVQFKKWKISSHGVGERHHCLNSSRLEAETTSRGSWFQILIVLGKNK